MKYEEEQICTSLKDLKTNEKIIIDRDSEGNITGIEKRTKSDCYVVTACYGNNSSQLKQVKKSCKNLFVKNMFLLPFWFLYKYVIGEELAYLYSNGIFRIFIKKMIAEKIFEYTKTQSLSMQLYLVVLGVLGIVFLPVFLVVKLVRTISDVFQVRKLI